MRITFLKETVKQLQIRLQKAYNEGDLKNVRRISVLLMVAEQQCIDKIILVWKVTRQTISNWIKALMNEGFDSLKYEKPKADQHVSPKRRRISCMRWSKKAQKHVATIQVAGQVS